MELMLKTHAISKKYKTQYAVNEVSMTLERGDIYGFVGENGAGKTTIIRMITGLITPTAGRYELFGVDNNSNELTTVRRRMSAVVETPSIALNMSAYDNLLMHAMTIGLADRSYIDDVLRITGLSNVRNDKKKVKNFSLGMKQRLSIAVALLGHPDFMILDEPMNGLDPEGIVEIRELILRLNREQNITFLISSHILEELSRIATKYGFLHRGNLVQEITRYELEENCRKCLELELDHTNNIAQALETKLSLLDYKLMGEQKVRIYDEVDIEQVVKAVSDSGMKVLKINTKNESIEEYYLNLMGGLKND